MVEKFSHKGGRKVRRRSYHIETKFCWVTWGIDQSFDIVMITGDVWAAESLIALVLAI